jgi:hypothetical protein
MSASHIPSSEPYGVECYVVRTPYYFSLLCLKYSFKIVNDKDHSEAAAAAGGGGGGGGSGGVQQISHGLFWH